MQTPSDPATHPWHGTTSRVVVVVVVEVVFVVTVVVAALVVGSVPSEVVDVVVGWQNSNVSGHVLLTTWASLHNPRAFLHTPSVPATHPWHGTTSRVVVVVVVTVVVVVAVVVDVTVVVVVAVVVVVTVVACSEGATHELFKKKSAVFSGAGTVSVELE